MEKTKFRIWHQALDENGNVIGTGVSTKEYVYWGTAYRKANELYGDMPNMRYEVARLNPFVEHSAEVTCDICGKTYPIRVNHDGFKEFPNNVTICSHGNIIPPNNHRSTRYYAHHRPCHDCIRKIYNFIESLKEEGTENG